MCARDSIASTRRLVPTIPSRAEVTMLTRVAVFEGALSPGSEDAFFADVTARLEPVLAGRSSACPGRAGATHDGGGSRPPSQSSWCSRWTSRAWPTSMIASPPTSRPRPMAATLEVLKPFTGRFFPLHHRKPDAPRRRGIDVMADRPLSIDHPPSAAAEGERSRAADPARWRHSAAQSPASACSTATPAISRPTPCASTARRRCC